MAQSLRMKAKRTFALNVLDGEDTVLWGITLPGKTVLNGFRVNLSYVNALVAAAELHEASEATALAVETWLIPHPDPDSPNSYDSFWDRFVPKDTDSEIIDLDTTSLDAAPFWEPGELNLNLALRLGNQPMRLSHWHKLLTITNGAAWIGQLIVSAADDPMWMPGGNLQIRVNKRVFIPKPALLICAMAIPNMNDVVTVMEPTLTEQEMLLVRFMRASLEGAIMHQIGISGAGATTWFDTASAALLNHLNPDVFEQVAGMFALAESFRLTGESSIDHTVEGELTLKSISGGRG